MKNLLVILSSLILFSSCFTEIKDENESLKSELDSLNQLATMKDSAINYFIKSINEIESNLEVIKEKESIITISSSSKGELDQSQKDRINEDIQLIYDLLIKNKETVNKLNKKFDQANIKIKEFEKTIERLNKQIEEKDLEINALREELIAMNIQIETLTSHAEQLTAESEKKSEIIEQKIDELNTAYYVFGSEKELKENQVITKEGGFIGLGKIEKLKDNFNKDYFTVIDIRESKTIPLFSKKAKIVTTHAQDSYKFYGENTVDSLVIIDPEKFWAASKYLVIIID